VHSCGAYPVARQRDRKVRSVRSASNDGQGVNTALEIINEALHIGHDIRGDIVTAFAVAMRTNVSPEYFGHKLEPLVRKWRPEVAMELDEECANA